MEGNPPMLLLQSNPLREGLRLGWTRFSIRSLMAATGLVAVPFAVLGVVPGGILSVSILTYSLVPLASRWTAAELSTTVAWLLGATLAVSNVCLDFFPVLFCLIA